MVSHKIEKFRIYKVLGVTLAACCGLPQLAVAQDQGARRLDEIVVTAQRREENLQDAPISVAAVTGQQLLDAGVGNSPADLSKLIPSIDIEPAGAKPQFAIRGVGNQAGNPYTDAAVGFNFNGVPITRTGDTIGMFYDLERVEVLKGPQGIFSGRNSTGGTLSVLPRRAAIGEEGGNFSIGFGSYDLVQGQGALALPISDSQALRVAVNVVERDGYYANGLSDDSGRSARLSYTWEPNDRLSIDLMADYHDQGGSGNGQVLLNTTGLDPARPAFAITDGEPYAYRDAFDAEINMLCDGIDDGATNFPVDTDDIYSPTTGCKDVSTMNFVDSDIRGFGLEVNQSFDAGDLVFIGSVRNSKGKSAIDFSQSEDNDVNSFEVRWASSTDTAFSYLVGYYQLDESFDAGLEAFSFGNRVANPVVQEMVATTDSNAFFGNIRYELTDNLAFSVGARRTKDDRTFVGTSTLPIPVPAVVTDADLEWSETTYHAGLEWNAGSDSLIFANYDEGYKAGGFFFAPFENTFEPEYITAYSIGTKNTFMDGRLLLNAEIFRYEYTDRQVSGPVQIEVPPGSGNLVQFFGVVNVGATDTDGLEIETKYLWGENTTLSANFQYLDAVITEDRNPANVGRQVTRSPKLAGVFGVTQAFPLSSGARVDADLSLQFRGDQELSTDYLPGTRVGSETNADIIVSYVPSGDAWRASLWVNNVTDNEQATRMQGFARVVGRPAPALAVYRAPRTYGVRFSMNW